MHLFVLLCLFCGAVYFLKRAFGYCSREESELLNAKAKTAAMTKRKKDAVGYWSLLFKLHQAFNKKQP